MRDKKSFITLDPGVKPIIYLSLLLLAIKLDRFNSTRIFSQVVHLRVVLSA